MYHRHLFGEVFDLKPTSILIGLGIGWINVAQKRPDDPRAAEHRRTPRRKRKMGAERRLRFGVRRCSAAF
jgi:hypothetical protein